MGVAITNIRYHTIGDQSMRTATITGDNSYPNPAGYALLASQFALSYFTSIQLGEVGGYTIAAPDLSTPLTSTHLHYYEGASGTTGATTATNATSAVVGTGTYTDAATSGALNVGAPVFSGTGQASAGQVITTTDNQTMALNQCAGMWFVSATHGPYLIASNTAVVGAPAVLTIYGTAPTTDAGTYKIVRNITVGSVTALAGTAAAQIQAAHTHTVGAAAGGEVPNGTNLSAVAFEITIFGY